MSHRKEFLIDALHIFTFVSLAFAQPLYVISKYAEIFVAHDAQPTDIILALLIPVLLIPASIIIMEYFAGKKSDRLRKASHYLVAAGLFSVISLILLKKYASGFSGNILLTGAVSLGIFITFLYVRSQDIRKLVTVFSPAIFIIPYFFLFHSPVTKIVFPEKSAFPKKNVSADPLEIKDAPPIIMVVFDEFPVTSLMDEDHRIDPVRYPNFAELAQDAYWFRNATSAHESTHYAVPVILTGNYPEKNKLPTATDYPNNLFTLLGNVYDLKVYESLTQLCPEQLCEKDTTWRVSAERIKSLLTDITFVCLHVILPLDFTKELPVITRSWKNFAQNTVDRDINQKNNTDHFLNNIENLFRRTWKEEMKTKDRGEVFRQFVRSIHATEKPTLYFQHNYLPHIPWSYLPSGKRYAFTEDKINGVTEGRWNEDELFIAEAYQRHLLQIGFVDKLLGELVERLKSVDLYDRSLIIITADHGVSFRPNDAFRGVTNTNYQDIMPIPLFIKVPNQDKGLITDRNVETIDILPTIADILSIKMPWFVDGDSAFDTSLPERTEKVIYSKHAAEDRHVFEPDIAAKYKTLRKKIALFGSGSDQYGLFKIGPHNELVGRPVSEIEVLGEANVLIQLDQASLFDNIDLKAIFVPAHITGRVVQNVETSEPLKLAFAVNKVIMAVSQSYPNEEKGMEFSVIVPEESFQAGKNEMDVYLVAENNNQLVLVRSRNKVVETYFLTSSGDIVSSKGASIQLAPDALRGVLNFADVKSDNIVRFSGWAADVKNFKPADNVAIFENGDFVYSGSCNLERPDLVKAYNNSGMLWTGFQYALPIELFRDIPNSEVRIFAISEDGFASEMNYPENYTWGKSNRQSQNKELASGLLQDEKTLPDETYILTKTGGEEEIIISPEGTSFQIVPHALKGSLDVVDVQGEYVHVSGWAADINNSEIPGAILIFVDKKFFFHGQLNSDRPDIAKTFNDEALEKSGFSYTFPLSRFEVVPAEARIFVLSERGLASELQYPEYYKWGTKL